MKKDDYIHARISSDLKKAAQQHAKDTGRTLAGLIEWLIRKELKENGIAVNRQERKETMNTIQKKFGLDAAALATLETAMKEHNLTMRDLRSSSYVQVFRESREQFADRELQENPESYKTREDVYEELKSDCYHVGDGYVVIVAP